MANPTQYVQAAQIPYDNVEVYWPLPTTADTYYPGELIGKRDSDGFVQHFDDTQALTFLGINTTTPQKIIDSTTPADELKLRIARPRLFSMPLDSGTASRLTDIGKPVYAVDSGHVKMATTGLTFCNLVGYVADVVTTKPTGVTGSQVYISPLPPSQLGKSGLLLQPSQDNITAFAGGGQASAKQLVAEINSVGTVATAGDSVKLPPSTPGLDVVLINLGSNSMQVYGAGTDTINGVATATGVAQMSNSVCIYSCTVAGKWVCEGIGGGFSGSLPTLSFATGITAFAGGGQASATVLAAAINRISTVATAGDSVRLPASAPGLVVVVDNRGVNPCQVFGAGTDTINGIATATGISQGVNTIIAYYCTVAGNWEVPLGGADYYGVSTLSVNGAIPAHSAHTYVITKGGVLADTLAAPTAVTDDGLVIRITSDTANAHTLTATGLLDTGTASVNLATFAAFKGAGLVLMAYNGRWKVLSSVGITFS